MRAILIGLIMILSSCSKSTFGCYNFNEGSVQMKHKPPLRSFEDQIRIAKKNCPVSYSKLNKNTGLHRLKKQRGY